MEKESNEINAKPQTGGLKLMTVFVAVLALHVLGIGGVAAYFWMKGNGGDSELLADKKAAAEPLPDKPVEAAKPAPAPAADQVTAADGAPGMPTAATPSGPVKMPAAAPAPAPLAPPPTAEMAEPASAPVEAIPGYIVKPGDTLARIARQHGTTTAKLKASNHLAGTKLHAGQKLVIPAGAARVVTHLPTLAPDAAMQEDAVPKLNAPKTAVRSAAETKVAAGASGRVYTVAKGDTLSKIARRYKTTPSALMTLNGISDPAKLGVGRKLKLPGTEARSATATAHPAPRNQPAEAAKPAASAQLANYDIK